LGKKYQVCPIKKGKEKKERGMVDSLCKADQMGPCKKKDLGLGHDVISIS